MSFEMMRDAVALEGLTSGEKLVALILADHHNAETGACFPSLNSIAKRGSMDRATVTRHLSRLEAKGRIERQKRNGSGGQQTSTQYTLNFADTPVAPCNSPCCTTQQPPVAPCNSPCCTTQQPPVASCNPNLESINQEFNHIHQPEADGLELSFDEFWNEVPKKVAKASARKAYAEAVKAADPKVILDGMRAYAASKVGQHQCYTKHPDNWLTEQLWTDTPPPPKATATADAFHERVARELAGEPEQAPTPPPAAPVESAEKPAPAATVSALKPTAAPAAPPEAKHKAPDLEAHAAFMKRHGFGHLPSLQQFRDREPPKPAYAIAAE